MVIKTIKIKFLFHRGKFTEQKFLLSSILLKEENVVFVKTLFPDFGEFTHFKCRERNFTFFKKYVCPPECVWQKFYSKCYRKN